jgi:hypothetical protein
MHHRTSSSITIPASREQPDMGSGSESLVKKKKKGVRQKKKKNIYIYIYIYEKFVVIFFSRKFTVNSSRARWFKHAGEARRYFFRVRGGCPRRLRHRRRVPRPATSCQSSHKSQKIEKNQMGARANKGKATQKNKTNTKQKQKTGSMRQPFEFRLLLLFFFIL